MAEEQQNGIHETSVRMDKELASRLSLIAQVTGTSMNQLMVRAIKESVIVTEGDEEFQEQRKAWLKQLQGVGK
jgi:predicted transcriptional regulator